MIFWPYQCLLTSPCFCLTQQGPGQTHISLHQTVFTLPGSGLFYPKPTSVHCGILYYLPSPAWCWWAHMLKSKRTQPPHWGSGKDSLFWSLRNWGRWLDSWLTLIWSITREYNKYNNRLQRGSITCHMIEWLVKKTGFGVLYTRVLISDLPIGHNATLKTLLNFSKLQLFHL